MSYTDDFWNALEEEKKKKKKKKNGSTTVEQSSAKSSGDSYTDEFFNELQSLQKKIAEVDNSFLSARGRFDDEDIAPVKEEEEEDDSLLDLFDAGALSAWGDGKFAWNDLSALPKAILGTGGDIVAGVGKGVFQFAEGISDAIGHNIVAPIARATGSDMADEWQKGFTESSTEKVFGGIDDFLDDYSVLGRTTRGVAEGIGQLVPIAAATAVGSPALGTALLGTSSFGSGQSEAFADGATYGEATAYGALSAGAEVVSEMLFGGLGKGINAIGYSKGLLPLDDMAATAVSKFFKSQSGKNVAEFVVKSGFEGLEEVIAGYLQAHAKKGTFKSEEDFAKILEDENLFEQFVVGSLVSGIAQSGDVHVANKTGRDFVTGNTQNEQAIIDKVVEDRIAEAEKDGTKLSGREKSKIQEEVAREMERGYIDTDTIEEVLGGDSYKAYKDSVDSENALKEELEALEEEYKPLYEMKGSDKSDAQIDRQAELKNRIAEIKAQLDSKDTKAQREQLKTKLGDDVRKLVQNDRLVESYLNKARVNEDFQADFDKYKGTKHEDAARKTIENAIKAGANNTNQVHDIVDLAAKTSADTGKVFTFKSGDQITAEFIERQTNEIAKLESIEQRTAEQDAELADMKELLEQVKNGDVVVDGDISNDGIVLNLDSNKPLNRVVGHEITHSFEPGKGKMESKEYAELRDSLFAYAKTKGIDIDSELKTRQLKYKGVANANAEAELVADLVGDFLFTDSDYVKRLSVENRNVFQKMWDEIKYLCKIATAGSREARELERVKKAFEDAYRESGQKQEADEVGDTETKYSIREAEPPKETGVAYKVFFVKDGKLYPPMVANPEGADTPMGVWLDADVGTSAPPSKTGRAQVKAGGKGTQGGSGSLAFRPGWHLGDLPRASQFDRVNPETGKKELFPENFVWAEVEYAKDVDYQEEAMSYGYTENGKFRHAYAGLPRLPENGYYRYRTNPKPDTVPWIITGAMKVNRLLSDAEVNEILEQNGVAPVHRQGGDVGLDKFGFDESGAVKYSLSQGENIDSEQNPWYNAKRGDEYVSTDEFRSLQEESQRMSYEDTQSYWSGSRQVDDEVRGRLSRTFGLELRPTDSKRISSVRTLLNPKTNRNVNIVEGVDASLFHDVFEISRKYLRNGELVDLHDIETTEDHGIGYKYCDNYLSEDGLSGFSITPDGDLISVFNLNNERGFLKTIAPIVKEKAKTLDCYASPNQNLMVMYEKIFGFKTASVMDYNMEYDHDNIAENHQMPRVAFMVNTESDVELREFTKDQYDEAFEYRNSFVNQAATDEAASFVSETDDIAPTKYSLGYHAGDLGKSEGYFDMVSSDRSTGHFGTGTYFVGDESKINEGNYGNRPHEKVNFENYHLFRPLYEKEGLELHTCLKYINDKIALFPFAKMTFDERYNAREKAENAAYTLFNDDATDAEKADAQKTLDSLGEQFEAVGYDPDRWSSVELYEKLKDISSEYGLTRMRLSSIFSRDMRNLDYDAQKAQIDSVMQSIYDEVTKIEDAYNAKYEDSPSTRFMKALGYEGIDVRGFKGLDNTNYGSVIYDLKGEDLARKNEIGTAKYSLSDSEGRELSPAVQNRFAKSKVVDEDGNLKAVYHGTASGEFTIFDKSKGSVEGDFGSGFYFTDNEYDVSNNYEGGGADFENKVARLAERIEQEEDISYAEAESRARDELYKGSHKFEVYLNIENPAVVGETTLLDYESFAEEYNREDYDSDEDYESDVEYLISDKIDEIIWEVEKNVDVYNTDGLTEVLWNAVNEGGIDIEQLKANINNLYLEDSEGNLVGNEVTRQIIESLGYDGIIDPTVSTKWNMDMEEGTTHYIVFKPNQIKSVTNENPTDNPDINLSLSKRGEQFAPIGKNDFFGRDFRKQSADDIAPVGISEATTPAVDSSVTAENVTNADDIAPVAETVDAKSVMVDRDSFVSKKAMELYQEITGLKKGVRASKSLGYLLDHGHDWRSIKTALLNIRDIPNQVVNPNSAAEAVAREMIGREYDAMVSELNDPSDVAGSIRVKMQNIQTEIANNEKLREQSNTDYDSEIAELQAEYDAKKNKNTIAANNLLRRIERLKRMKNTNDGNYAQRIGDLEARLEKMSKPTYKTAAQRKAKQTEYTNLFANLVGDTSTWVDKKLGISYKVNTLRRNLRDVVRDANGNQDIPKADAIYDELQGNYNHNEAELKRESRQIKSPFAELDLNHAEDTYAHMLGEFRHNPDSQLTEQAINEFYEKNKNKIDTKKVDAAIEESRKVFDELIVRVNERLKEQGMKEIPYRKGYFPHFTNPKQGWLAKLFNWKTVDTEIPTSIAGLTETFNPERSWQGFSKQRKGDTTDYSLEQGLDTYIHGALDWIYHIEDIQKNRAFENYLRYIHSEEGVKARIDAINNSEELDADEAQRQIDAVYAEANNPLNNLVTNLRARTNTLANKKSENDRQIETDTNRKIYSVMTNLNNRISANMVVGSFSSALTNFIPITQSWVEVSPVYSLRGMKDTIKSTIRDDGMVGRSDFLTNRLLNEENLYQTTWDKISDKAAFMMEAIDSFSSQTVWRSKYLQNISEGMSETEAIKNADQFAENVIAGRSRGNQPTIFDAKNPFTKMFTAFQLEVSNQYGYMFKDAPQDSKNKARLVKGYATAFLGAYAYNALYSSLVGRDAAFDPIGILEDLFRDMGLFGDDDDEEKEPDEIALNFTENILQEVPFFGGLIGGGRIPISSAIPYGGDIKTIVSNIANGESSTKEWLKPVYYLALPFGGGQIKKTNEGLGMFSDEHPIAGSYTDSGNLRFPVEDTIGNRIQAGIFGQYASENARDYFDNNRSPLKEKQIQEFIDVDIPIRDYWEYREGLADQKTIEDKFDYIAGLDLPVSKKNILINNIVDREEDVDLEGYEDFSSYDEFDFATKNPGKYAVSQAVGGYDSYSSYMEALGDIEADKDENGKSISGSKKEKVINYIESLPIDYGMKIILFKSMYDSKEDRNAYNADIVEYLNNRDDISYEDMVTILTELGMRIEGNNVYWD